jgi:hypothetical protein
MSENRPIGLTIIEKLLGLTLIIVGALFAFQSTSLLPDGIKQFSGIFTVLGVVIIGAGIFLIIVRTK